MTDIGQLLAELEAEYKDVSDEQDRLARKAAALHKTLAGLRELASLNGHAVVVVDAGEKPLYASNAFVGMPLTAAAIEYLKIIDKPQTHREIVEGLIAGGVTSTAQDFSATLRAVLLRENEKPNGQLEWQVPHWVLREWAT